MDNQTVRQALKRQLLSEVAWFYKQDHLLWKAPIVKTMRELQETSIAAVFFGGTLRSLLLSRLLKSRRGRPRDLDIVVSGASLEHIKERFRNLIKRQTRFGGLQLERLNWQFDVWPLDRTWGFINDKLTSPAFESLPQTTFFNLEAIAVDVWPRLGKTRTIYSGDDQFFDGIITNTLELNRSENPFPALCVIRSLVMAASLDYSIGPKLAAYLSARAATIHHGEFETIQREHYGRLRYDGDTMRRWLDSVVENHARRPNHRMKLPFPRQQTFWPEKTNSMSFRLRVLQERK